MTPGRYKKLIGVSEVTSHKAVSQQAAVWDVREYGAQAKGAFEHNAMFSNAKFSELVQNGTGYVFYEHGHKIRPVDALWEQILPASNDLRTLIDPSKQVLAQTDEHLDLAVAPIHDDVLANLLGRLVTRKPTVQSQTGPSAR